MKFLILLIVLGIERYLNISPYLHRFNWFNRYLNFESKYLRNRKLWQGYLGVALVTLPILIAVAIFYYALKYVLFGFGGFIISSFIFLYCLGPKDLYAQLERYFTLLIEPEHANIDPEPTVQDLIMEDNSGANFERKLSRGMFWTFNQRVFAVSFWFIVLGPLGALFYRLVYLLNEAAKQPASNESEMLTESQWLLNVFDWLPVRFVGLGYALMGNFVKGFSYWLKHAMTGLKANREIAIDSGIAALDIETQATSDLEENHAVLALIDRTLIMYVLVVLVFTLGALVY